MPQRNRYLMGLKCHDQMPRFPYCKILNLHSLPVGANYGGWFKMETITTTNCGSLTPNELGEKAEKSTLKSKPNLRSGRARAGTRQAVKTPAECEVRLSILQAAFDQFLES